MWVLRLVPLYGEEALQIRGVDAQGVPDLFLHALCKQAQPYMATLKVACCLGQECLQHLLRATNDPYVGKHAIFTLLGRIWLAYFHQSRRGLTSVPVPAHHMLLPTSMGSRLCTDHATANGIYVSECLKGLANGFLGRKAPSAQTANQDRPPLRPDSSVSLSKCPCPA